MRRFELVEGTSSKFWEIDSKGSTVKTRWGRIGTDGQSKDGKLASPAAATAAADKQIAEKLKKGYSEVTAGAAKKKAAPAKQEVAAADHPFPREVPKLAAPAAGAALGKQLATFEQAVDIGPLAWTDELAKGRSKAEIDRGEDHLNKLFQPIRARILLIEELAKRLVEHADDRKAAEALTRVVREHPCDRIRRTVGGVVVDAGVPGAALPLIAGWVDTPANSDHWRWQTGARAVLHQDPAAAFKKLTPYLKDEAFSKRVIDAVREHPGTIDPRFFEALIAFLPDKPGTPNAQAVFEKYGERPEVQALLVEATEKLAAGKAEPKWGYFYQMLRAIKVPGALPALLKIAARAAKRGDWQFTTPLSAIEELADPAALPALRELADTLKGKSKSAVQAVITGLDKQAPAKKGKGKGKAAAAGTPLARLVAAGLAEERAEAIVALARNRIDLAAKKVGKPPVGTTRFGGEPDLPAQTEWPHVTCTKQDFAMDVGSYDEGTFPAPDKKGKYQVPLAFVAQIDLADLAAHDEDGLLPKTGMLWFFALQAIVIGEKRELQQLGAQVIYSKTKTGLTRTAFPDSLPERERYDPAAITVSHARPLPHPHVAPMRELGLVHSESKALETATTREDLGTTHASLGWAQATYYMGIPDGKEQLLLRCGSDGVSGFEWGDAASIFFCIPTAALAKQDFAKTYCIMDE